MLESNETCCNSCQKQPNHADLCVAVKVDFMVDLGPDKLGWGQAPACVWLSCSCTQFANNPHGNRQKPSTQPTNIRCLSPLCLAPTNNIEMLEADSCMNTGCKTEGGTARPGLRDSHLLPTLVFALIVWSSFTNQKHRWRSVAAMTAHLYVSIATPWQGADLVTSQT